jgi:hypothetical protein
LITPPWVASAAPATRRAGACGLGGRCRSGRWALLQAGADGLEGLVDQGGEVLATVAGDPPGHGGGKGGPRDGGNEAGTGIAVGVDAKPRGEHFGHRVLPPGVLVKQGGSDRRGVGEPLDGKDAVGVADPATRTLRGRSRQEAGGKAEPSLRGSVALSDRK